MIWQGEEKNHIRPGFEFISYNINYNHGQNILRLFDVWENFPFNNHCQNILRHFDVWENFSFTTSEMKRDYS